MSFDNAEEETRQRFAETLTLYNHLRSVAPTNFVPLDDVQKALRGLWLVSLYAAVERSTNAIVEAALQEVSGHDAKSMDCVPALHTIFHYSKVQSIKDCGRNRVFDTARALFEASLADAPMKLSDNPLAESLQNVDASTLEWIIQLFGGDSIDIPGHSAKRLQTLRERRNAVAHGRESASEVGERYSLDELHTLYKIADSTITTFLYALRNHCVGRNYLRGAA
jgi:hypothetical protein